MPIPHRCLTQPVIIAIALTTALNGLVAAQQVGQAIKIVGPVEADFVPDKASMLTRKLDRLAKIDPDHPLADEVDTQTLSMFGREDLIAASSSDYEAQKCAPLDAGGDALTKIEEMARRTSIVIINESHERSEYRGFIAAVAKRLRPSGYDTLAMETLSNPQPNTPARFLPLFVTQPNLSYFVDNDGYYLSEAGFGRLGRTAKALGYRLLSYELNKERPADAVTREAQIAFREEAQARDLASFVKDHPTAKLLIHVGYSHASEVPQTKGEQWMAMRLKQKTGIDPLTISQTTCHGTGDRIRLSALPADEPKGLFDLVVDHPQARFERSRPVWRRLAGDRPIDIPRALRPTKGWRVIEARPVGESATSVPMDRIAIRPGEDIPLMLPPGRYRLRIIDPMAAAAAAAELKPAG